jgi:hypothetical protein
VDSDNISKSLNDWEIFEFVSIHDKLSEFSFSAERWINNLEDTHEEFFVALALDALYGKVASTMTP